MNKIFTFDCYGTLLNTDALYEFVKKTAQANDLPSEKASEIFTHYEDRLMYGEDYIPYNELLYNALEYCDMELNTDVFAAEWNNMIHIHKSFSPYKDVIPALTWLKNQGYELALMSNTTHEIMNWHLEKLGDLFDHVLLAEDTKCYKPNLLFFKMAEERFSLSEKEHCHIAKGYWWDIVPASKLGWKKIWVNRKNLKKGRDAEQPYVTIHSLEELKNII